MEKEGTRLIRAAIEFKLMTAGKQAYLNSEDSASISVEQKAALLEELRKLRDATRPSEVFGVDQALIEDADIQPYDQRIVRLAANLANVESILRDVVEREVFASMPDAVANIEQLRKGIGSFNKKWRDQFSILASANDAAPTTHHAVQAPTTIISFSLEQRHCVALNKLKFPDRQGKYLMRRKGKVYRHVVDRYMKECFFCSKSWSPSQHAQGELRVDTLPLSVNCVSQSLREQQ